MTPISSAAALVAKQNSELKMASSAGGTSSSDAPTVKASFDDILSQVRSAVTGKPRTGFTSGPTADANSISGKAKAAFDNAVSTAKSLNPIKPKTGFNQ
jgi:hypothetical protein